MSASSELVAYQRAVVELLFRRDPEPYLQVLGGDTERWRVYRRMARRRLEDCILDGFPRTTQLLGEGRMHAVVERFFDEAPPRSPYLRDVPQELAAFFERNIRSFDARAGDAPPWLLELVRHEATLLDVGFTSQEVSGRATAEEEAGEEVAALSMERPAVLSPAHRILRARFAVHRLGDDGDASAVVEGPFALCLYRDPTTHRVRALELTDVAASLLEEIGLCDRPLVEVLRAVAEKEGVPVDAVFVTGVTDLIADLMERGLWLGSLSS
jgi:hypothetical protein